MAPQVTEQVMDEVKSGMHLSLIVLLGVVVGYWIVSTIVSYRRLSHIKGPPLAAVTQLWYMKSMLSGQSAVDLSEVCDKYGTAVILPSERPFNPSLSPFPIGSLTTNLTRSQRLPDTNWTQSTPHVRP